MDFSNLTWDIWWMLLSGGVACVGFIGRQLVQFFVGAKKIVKGEGEYSSTEAALLPDRLANKEFEADVSRRALGTQLGAVFFWMLVLGLLAHAGFWVYAATALQ